MFIRVINNEFGDGEFREVPPPPIHCAHYAQRTVKGADGKPIGMVIEVCRDNLKDNFTIELPRDGHVVYIMNDGGDTVNTIHWPPRAAAPSRRRKGKKYHGRRSEVHDPSAAEAGCEAGA